MFSLALGICQGRDSNYNGLNRIAAVIDTAGFITALVLGILAVAGLGHLPVSSPVTAWSLTFTGVLGILIIAFKNIKSVDNPVNHFSSSQPQRY